MLALNGLGADFFSAIGACLRGWNARYCLDCVAGCSFWGDYLHHGKMLSAFWTVHRLSCTGFVNDNMLATLVTIELNVHVVRY